MTNKIYIVAGERNMELAALGGAGLYVNVGQTTRDVEDRLSDDDYKRKAAGGKWKVILLAEVGELTDKDIHPILKNHPRVYWDPNSNNTEEFLFIDDPGDGSVAKKIVIDILTQHCEPLLLEDPAAEDILNNWKESQKKIFNFSRGKKIALIENIKAHCSSNSWNEKQARNLKSFFDTLDADLQYSLHQSVMDTAQYSNLKLFHCLVQSRILELVQLAQNPSQRRAA
jgi:hypothetical protein